MADRLIIQSDELLERLDNRVGNLADYIIPGEPSTNIETGVTTRGETVISDVKVRRQSLNTRQLSELSGSGIDQVETQYNIRSSYLSNVEAEPDHELVLKDTGFRYRVVRPILDQLGVDYQLFVQRIRS